MHPGVKAHGAIVRLAGSQRAPRGLGRLAALGGLALGAMLWSAAAAAAPGSETVEGHVVAVEQGDVVVDLALQQGAADDDVVELWRPLSLIHPVTKRQVTDRFLIGRLRLRQVRQSLALAIAEGAPDRAPERGDVVVLRRTRPEAAHGEPGSPPTAVEAPAGSVPAAAASRPAQPTSTEPAGSAAADCPAADPYARAAHQVTTLFEGLRGTRPERRIVAYKAYLASNPSSPFAASLTEQLGVLRRLAGLEAVHIEARRIVLGDFHPPERALSHAPLTLGIRIGGEPVGAVLQLRATGEPTYRSLAMKPSGGGYFAVTLPAEDMVASGLEYFIEGTGPDGKATVVAGEPGKPLALEVFAPPSPHAPALPAATASLWTDYADYNRLRGDDVAWQTEGVLGMRFGDSGVRAVRTGFGVYRGVGGSLADLDELGLSARKVGLTYGYLEGEIGIGSFVGLVGRGIVGMDDGGLTGGAQALVRVGSDLETNLLVGCELLGGVGLRAMAEVDIAVLADWPIMLRAEVTNQPAGAESSLRSVRPADDAATPESTSLARNDIGVRAIAQVGYRIVDPLTVALRVSYQGRTIWHSGPGFGGAVSYTW